MFKKIFNLFNKNIETKEDLQNNDLKMEKTQGFENEVVQTKTETITVDSQTIKEKGLQNKHTFSNKIVSKEFNVYDVQEKFENTIVIESLEDRKFGVPFRKEETPENIVYFIQKQPQGTPKKLYTQSKIAGVSYRQKDAIKFAANNIIGLRAVKDPENQFDKNAIKIMGDFKINGQKDSVQLGFIPKQYASKLVKFEEINLTLRTIYIPKEEERNISFEIDIWVKRQNKTSKSKNEFKELSYDPTIKVPNDYASRNTLARELETKGYLDNAIEMYTVNTKDKMPSLYPFKRLAIIYRKRKDYQSEIQVVKDSLVALANRGINHETEKRRYNEMKQRLIRVEELIEKSK